MKEYIVDISKSTCWNEIVLEYKKQILDIIEIIKPMYISHLKYFNAGLWLYKITGGRVMYENEIREILNKFSLIGIFLSIKNEFELFI